ncbi:MAG: site-2 protease family protein, partial [Bacteroidia bacterium]|nr:site-2 protease family protein [Bacteroidia bacterium]
MNFRFKDRDFLVEDRTYQDRYWLHILLFIATVITTTMAGAEMVTNRRWFSWGELPPEQLLSFSEWTKGLPYSFSFVLFLTVHEFGHYFTAMYYQVRCSLPYYIPVFLPTDFLNIGSFGAIIRLRQMPDSTIKYFDIGIAGPIAGFVVAVGLLWYGFATLPPLDYLYEMNPNYLKDFGHIPTEDELLEKYGGGLKLGTSLILQFFEWAIADPTRLPTHYEYIHYPYIFAGFIT